MNFSRIICLSDPLLGRYGELYQAHEGWDLPGQRPTLARMAAYALGRWVTSDAAVLDTG
ncbi:MULTISPECIES: hypothetical protein [Methylobacillus]|uniref:hypothetical protein n=1 Tax=Methylobacillus TaxID=404 RepID=UPI000045F324|nr:MULTISPECIES: hypothetical protein [Methylobacillus]